MFVLDSVCSDSRIETIIRLAKMFLQLLQILIPIALILLGSIDLGRAVMASDEGSIKKAQKRFFSRCIAAVLVFLAAIIVRFAMGFVGNNAWQDCWNDVSAEKPTVCKYQMSGGNTVTVRATPTSVNVSSTNPVCDSYSGLRASDFDDGCPSVIYYNVMTNAESCIYSPINMGGIYTSASLIEDDTDDEEFQGGESDGGKTHSSGGGNF